MGGKVPNSMLLRSILTPIFCQKPTTASPIYSMKGVPGSARFQKVKLKPLG